MPDPGSPAQPPADGAAPPPGGAAQSSGGAAQSSAAQPSGAQPSGAQPSGVQPPPGARPRRPSDGPTRVADQPTVVQRLIVRYAKRSRMRFASHRDIARAFERGVRRARLPIAYSAGFTPHPKISYAGAAPTGTASEAEYLELSLTATCVVAEVRDRLNAALPDGIDVIDVTEEAGSLGAVTFEASQWEVALPGVGRDEAAAAAETFLAQDSVEVERLTSKGMRRMDARAAVVTLQAGWCPADERDAGYAILRMVVRHLTPAVRPDDILTALRRVAGLVPSSPPLVTRLVQGPLVAVAAAAGPAGQHVPAGPTEASSAVTAPPSRGVTPLGPQSAGQGAAQTHVKTTRLGARSAALAGPPSASAYDQLPRGAEGSERTHAPGSLTGDSPDARNRAQRFTAERDSARQ
jgi:radical SAM-linked protein